MKGPEKMKTLEGKLVSDGMKVGIVAARFNEFITSKLVSGAMDGLTRHNVKEEDIQVAWVPGAFEIPLIASKMAKSGKYDAVICVGAVIMIMYAMRFPKGLHQYHWKQEFRYYSEYLPQKTSSRQLNAQVQKQEIKAMTVHSVPLKW